MPELLKHRNPVARKPHRCASCGGMAVRPGELYDRSTYVEGGRLFDWVSCLPCKRLAPVVSMWVVDADEGVGRDDFCEWASEMANDVVHGEAARAWLFRAGLSVQGSPVNTVVVSGQLHQVDALFDIEPVTAGVVVGRG
jgi:hypothetical protein